MAGARAAGSFLADVVATAPTPDAARVTPAVFAALAVLYAAARPRPRAGQRTGG